MNLETKLKAISACAKAAQEVADAINQGSFDDLLEIFQSLIVELNNIKVRENIFPDGGFPSDSATEFKVSDEEYLSRMQGLLKRYRNRESPEQYEARKANYLPFPISGIVEIRPGSFIGEFTEQIQEEE